MTVHLVDCTMFWSASGGGCRRYLLAKRGWLQDRQGWRHTLAVPGGGNGGPGFADCGGLPLPGSGGYRLPLRRSAGRALLERLQPDLIEAGDPWRLAWSVLDAAERLPVPALAFCHSNPMAMAEQAARSLGLAAAAPAARRAGAAYLARLYGRFDLVLAPSEWMRAQLLEIGIRQVSRQPLGVDSRLFSAQARDPAWRRRVGLPDRARVLLYLGRFALEKHLQVLAEAVDRLGPPYLLLAVGTGPVPPRGVRVRTMPWVGEPRQLATLLASVDALVHAGDQETFGLSVLEAMASGTPVAVRRAAGLAELVEEGCGLGVDSTAAAQWAQAIEALFDSGRERRIALARRRAEGCDWREVLPGLERTYLSLMPRRGRTPAAAPA